MSLSGFLLPFPFPVVVVGVVVAHDGVVVAHDGVDVAVVVDDNVVVFEAEFAPCEEEEEE